MGRLDGKVAVVTGGGGGLGSAMCSTFAAEGASVVCQDLDEAAAKATVDAIAGAGGPDAMAHACDVSDSAAIDTMFEAIDARFGPVTVLVNCAGVDRTPGDGSGQGNTGTEMQIVAMSDAGWQRMLDIHLNGAFYCTLAMMKRLVDTGQGGSVICISSIAGTAGWGPVHYATAKAGLLGFIRSLARFCGAFGVRANAICPGVIDTPMTQAIAPELLDPLKLMTPMGRLGEPSDIANAALYLASDESAFVTGQFISPNGGLVIS
jgi:3-oxoacyl-[acyl-carrier protein] reductase